MWDLYSERVAAHGNTKRDATLKREVRLLNRRAPDSLSYHTVTVFDSAHGYNIDNEDVRSAAYEQNVTIINSDNLNEKKLHTMPGDDMKAGSLIEWMDNHWLVTEKDANATIYTTVKLLQCNYLLRWVSEDDRKVYEQWCVVEDGTKLLERDSFRVARVA